MAAMIAGPHRTPVRRRIGVWVGLVASYCLLGLILAFGREPGDPPIDAVDL